VISFTTGGVAGLVALAAVLLGAARVIPIISRSRS